MTRLLAVAAALLGIAAPSAHAGYAEVIAASAPVHHWTLDDAVAPFPAAVGADALRLWNTTTSHSVRQPAGIEVGGTSITLSGSAFLATGSAATAPGRTVEAWIAPSTTGGTRYVFSRGSGTSGYHLYLNAGKLSFAIGGRTVTAPTVLAANQWYHVAGTLSGTSVGLYVDGRLEASTTLTATQSTSTQTLYVGRAAASSSSAYRFQGGLDEPAVYGRGLTPAQVSAHYQAGLDPVPLGIVFGAAPAAVSDQPDGRIEFGATKGGVSFQCTLDDLPAEPCSGSFDYELLRDGEHTLRVDAARRGASVGATHAWRVALPANETAPPVTTLTAAPAALVNSSVATFAFSGSKTRLTYQCRLDGGTWTGCPASGAYANLKEGAHTFEVRATDRWGVVEQAPRQFAWRIDLTPPDTFALAAKARRGDPGSVVLGSEAGATFQCRPAEGEWFPCEASFALPVMAASSQMDIRAVDAAGNGDPSPATITLDPAPLDAPILFSGASASFVVGGVRDIAALQCSLDGAAPAKCAWPLDFHGLGYGRHTLTVTDANMPGVVFPTVEWTDPLPVPKIVGSQFPAVLSLGSRRKQASLAASRLPRILFQSNAAGTATVELRRGRKVLRRWSSVVVQGSNLVRLPRSAWRRLRPARYRLAVLVKNASGASAPLLLRFDAVRGSRR